MDLLKILLIITLLSIPTGEVLRIQLTSEAGINLIDILISITGIYGISYLIKNKTPLKNYEKYFLGFISLGIISLVLNIGSLNNNQILISSLYPIRLLFLFMILPLVRIQEKKFKEKLTTILIFDGFIIVALGLAQFFLYPSLRNLYYLGWDEHLYRIFSTFLDPNFTAVFIALFTIFIFPKAISMFKTKAKMASFFTLMIVLSIISLILTYSRAVLLSFSVVSFLFLFLNKKKHIPFLIVILGAIILLQINTVRSEGTNLFRTTSTFARLGSSSLAISVIKDNPILGVGFNSYRYVSEKYNKSQQNKLSLFPSHGLSSPDNSFLFVLATTGVLGFAMYLMFWRTVIKNYFKNLKNLDNQVIILSIATLFISSFFVNALFYTPILLWFFSVLGIKENN